LRSSGLGVGCDPSFDVPPPAFGSIFMHPIQDFVVMNSAELIIEFFHGYSQATNYYLF
jgi:hypothetical protein